MPKLFQHIDQRRAAKVVRGRSGDRQPPDPERPIGTDTLPEIRHIVVLMMENHSFDNYFGCLGRGDGLPTPIPTNPLKDGTPVPAYHLESTVQAHGSPTQSWHASHIQWDKGKLDGFPHSVETTVPKADPKAAMGYWTEDDLPFYASLARTFPLADRWFCSCLGPTFPNRRFLIAGTANGLIDDLPFGMVDYPENGTIFDSLAHHDISWLNYHDVSKTKTVFKRALGRHGLTFMRYVGLATFKWFPPLINAVRGNMQFTADLYPLGLARAAVHLRTLQQFFKDADEGKLPAFSIVDPDFSKFSEEDPQDIQLGEGFAAEVINRVMKGKGWANTLLIWLYDEHGGYYDHVPPPEAPPPDDVKGHSLAQLPRWFKALLRPVAGTYIKELEAIDTGTHTYDRYGLRVPAVIVSPYARRDCVTSQVYDHTSILKLIERKWNLPPLTHRDAAASDPLEALDLENPPAFLVPPTLAAPAQPWKPSA
jgi:phospholipase C